MNNLVQKFGDFMHYNVRGIGLCLCIAATAFYLSGEKFGSFSMEIIGAPVISILIGMALNMLECSRERIKVANMLPAIFLPILWFAVLK